MKQGINIDTWVRLYFPCMIPSRRNSSGVNAILKHIESEDKGVTKVTTPGEQEMIVTIICFLVIDTLVTLVCLTRFSFLSENQSSYCRPNKRIHRLFI